MGLWLGRLVLPDTRGASSEPPAAPQAITSGSMTVIPPEAQPDQPTPVPGRLPVATDEAPIDVAPRIWLPEIADTQGIYAFGTIPSDDEAAREILIENVGAAVLVIESVTASCGCTAAVVDTDRVEPGNSTLLRVTYDPRINGEAGQLVSKQVRIQTNDPLAPVAEFTVTADVRSK